MWHLAVARSNIERTVPTRPLTGDSEGLGPIYEAIKATRCDIVECLLDAGTDVNEQAANGAFSPLKLAVSTRDRDLVKLLLDRSADPNLATGHGASPLAMVWPDDEAVKALLKAYGAVEGEPSS